MRRSELRLYKELYSFLRNAYSARHEWKSVLQQVRSGERG